MDFQEYDPFNQPMVYTKQNPIEAYDYNVNIHIKKLQESEEALSKLVDQRIKSKSKTINDLLSKYDETTNQIIEKISQRNEKLEFRERQIDIELRKKYDNFIDREITKFDDVLEGKIRDFEEGYANTSETLKRLVKKHVDDKSKMMNSIFNGYRQDLFRMMEEVKLWHSDFKEEMRMDRNRYPKTLVKKMMENYLDLDIDEHMETKLNRKFMELDDKFEKHGKLFKKITDVETKINKSVIENKKLNEKISHEYKKFHYHCDLIVDDSINKIKRHQNCCDHYVEEACDEFIIKKLDKNTSQILNRMTKVENTLKELKLEPKSKLNSKTIQKICHKVKTSLIKNDYKAMLNEEINNCLDKHPIFIKENKCKLKQNLNNKNEKKQKTKENINMSDMYIIKGEIYDIQLKCEENRTIIEKILNFDTNDSLTGSFISTEELIDDFHIYTK